MLAPDHGVVLYGVDFTRHLARASQRDLPADSTTDASQKYYDLAITRYRTGVDSYLDVFTAQTLLLTQQQTTLNLRVEQMTSNVQLIEALGGGWDNAQLPSEKAVAAK